MSTPAIERLKALAAAGPDCKVVREDDCTVVAFAGTYDACKAYMRSRASINGWHIMGCKGYYAGRFLSFVL